MTKVDIPEIAAIQSRHIRIPATWRELQKMHEDIRESFHEERRAVLMNQDSAHPFAVVDSTITQAIWSRKTSDDPEEHLPVSLKATATEMLDLMDIRLHEGVMDKARDFEKGVVDRASAILASIRKRCGFTTEYAS